jgi:hypothetical protein
VTNYVINFWRWWYGHYALQILQKLYNEIIFILESTNTLSMAKNLSKPMFQDDSGIGRGLGFFIRLAWVWFGGIFAIVVVVPLLLAYLVYLLLPVIAVIMISIFLVSQIL